MNSDSNSDEKVYTDPQQSTDLTNVNKNNVDQNVERYPSTNVSIFDCDASRILRVSNLNTTLLESQVKSIFLSFGEIIDMSVKYKNTSDKIKKYCAYITYVDIFSVVEAIKTMSGKFINGNCLLCKFGFSPFTNLVWVGNVAKSISENNLISHFKQFGVIRLCLIDRSRDHALLYFNKVKYAMRAVDKMRGKILNNQRIQIDFSSTLQEYYFIHCIKENKLKQNDTMTQSISDNQVYDENITEQQDDDSNNVLSDCESVNYNNYNENLNKGKIVYISSDDEEQNTPEINKKNDVPNNNSVIRSSDNEVNNTHKTNTQNDVSNNNQCNNQILEDTFNNAMPNNSPIVNSFSDEVHESSKSNNQVKVSNIIQCEGSVQNTSNGIESNNSVINFIQNEEELNNLTFFYSSNEETSFESTNSNTHNEISYNVQCNEETRNDLSKQNNDKEINNSTIIEQLNIQNCELIKGSSVIMNFNKQINTLPRIQQPIIQNDEIFIEPSVIMDINKQINISSIIQQPNTQNDEIIIGSSLIMNIDEQINNSSRIQQLNVQNDEIIREIFQIMDTSKEIGNLSTIEQLNIQNDEIIRETDEIMNVDEEINNSYTIQQPNIQNDDIIRETFQIMDTSKEIGNLSTIEQLNIQNDEIIRETDEIMNVDEEINNSYTIQQPNIQNNKTRGTSIKMNIDKQINTLSRNEESDLQSIKIIRVASKIMTNNKEMNNSSIIEQPDIQNNKTIGEITKINKEINESNATNSNNKSNHQCTMNILRNILTNSQLKGNSSCNLNDTDVINNETISNDTLKTNKEEKDLKIIKYNIKTDCNLSNIKKENETKTYNKSNTKSDNSKTTSNHENTFQCTNTILNNTKTQNDCKALFGNVCSKKKSKVCKIIENNEDIKNTVNHINENSITNKETCSNTANQSSSTNMYDSFKAKETKSTQSNCTFSNRLSNTVDMDKHSKPNCDDKIHNDISKEQNMMKCLSIEEINNLITNLIESNIQPFTSITGITSEKFNQSLAKFSQINNNLVNSDKYTKSNVCHETIDGLELITNQNLDNNFQDSQKLNNSFSNLTTDIVQTRQQTSLNNLNGNMKNSSFDFNRKSNASINNIVKNTLYSENLETHEEREKSEVKINMEKHDTHKQAILNTLFRNKIKPANNDIQVNEPFIGFNETFVSDETQFISIVNKLETYLNEVNFIADYIFSCTKNIWVSSNISNIKNKNKIRINNEKRSINNEKISINKVSLKRKRTKTLETETLKKTETLKEKETENADAFKNNCTVYNNLKAKSEKKMQLQERKRIKNASNDSDSDNN